MSFTKGVSFHHETNASSQPTINNNISIQTSNEAGYEIKTDNPYAAIDSGGVRYDQTTNTEPTLPNETLFLKKVLNIYMGQKFYFSGKYLVLTANELLDLLSTLLPNRQIQINADDFDVECCGSSHQVPYAKIASIWVDDEQHQQQNFKYAHSNLVAVFENYKISTKFIRSA